jgi:hypothetical protein
MHGWRHLAMLRHELICVAMSLQSRELAFREILAVDRSVCLVVGEVASARSARLASTMRGRAREVLIQLLIIDVTLKYMHGWRHLAMLRHEPFAWPCRSSLVSLPSARF